MLYCRQDTSAVPNDAKIQEISLLGSISSLEILLKLSDASARCPTFFGLCGRLTFGSPALFSTFSTFSPLASVCPSVEADEVSEPGAIAASPSATFFALLLRLRGGGGVFSKLSKFSLQ